jgi:hypothetical protein
MPISSKIAALMIGTSLCGAGTSVLAQNTVKRIDDTATATSSRDKAETASRALSRREGLALRDFALAQPANLEPKPDCSHLMHQTFAAAGLEYPYANSFDIYSGIPQFRRVKSPQPGDLIVWRGHVGLVVNPGEKSFYSSLGSGIQTDQYDNRYWRRRGTPRFYRYLTDASDKTLLLASRARPLRQVPATPAEPAAIEPESPAEAEVAAVTTADLPSGNSSAAAEKLRVPQSIDIFTTNGAPTRDDVAQALSELTNASGAVLRQPSPREIASPVVIFDRLRVEKVKIQRDQGWAEVRIKVRMQLDGDRINNKTSVEKRRWELRRGEQGWQALAPADRIYVPADVGVQVLAEKLALLSRDHKEERTEQAKIARLLDTLLNQN